VARSAINHYEERAFALRRSGYFVVFVDYLRRRHLTDCAGGRDISHAQVAADVLEAAQWIMGEARIASGKVFAIGWSYGGDGVLAAVKAMPAQPPLIGKVVLYYPDCRQATPWPSGGVSVMILMGGMDEVTPPTACEHALTGAPANGLSTVTYPNARHGFDVRGLPKRTKFGRLGFDRGAADAAWAVTLDFLR
jgi:dienelactone hydrolase